MITALYERVRDSLFLIPASIIAGLGILSQVGLLIDRRLLGDQAWLLSTTVDSSRAILTTTATATITVAAIVFSMTAVVVQLATSQFSPRVTQGFLRDRAQQATIGITVGTFVYALLVLASVRGVEGSAVVSHDFSATVAVVLAVGSMLAIVSFIDRIMRSMRIDTIVARLASETEKAVKRLPEREILGEESLVPPDTATVTTVAMPRTGWVRSIDVSKILDALDGNRAVRLDLRVGDYVAAGEKIATVWPEVEPDNVKGIVTAIEVDLTRTIASDPMHGIRQMVDIALRALSSSMNDPTTAADVIHHLLGPLREVLMRQLPGRVVHDEHGNRVYMPRVLTHSDYVHGAFREIRMNADSQPHVLHALVETLGSLVSLVTEAGFPGRTEAAVAEAQAVVETIKQSPMRESDKAQLLGFARQNGLISTSD